MALGARRLGGRSNNEIQALNKRKQVRVHDVSSFFFPFKRLKMVNP